MSEVKNKVLLTGKISKDPIIKTIASGRKFAIFTIATTDMYYKNEEKIFETQWHNMKAWGKIAEEVEDKVSKGDKVSIDGKLTNRSYVDKNGQKKYITEILVNELTIVN